MVQGVVRIPMHMAVVRYGSKQRVTENGDRNNLASQVSLEIYAKMTVEQTVLPDL